MIETEFPAPEPAEANPAHPELIQSLSKDEGYSPRPQPFDPANPLPGLYAIVEVLGHRRYAGRVAEVTRFGATFLAIEPLFQDCLLPPVLIGGSSIYQFTACDAATAWSRRAEFAYDLQGGPGAIAAQLNLVEDETAFKPRFLGYDDGGSDLVDEFGEQP